MMNRPQLLLQIHPARANSARDLGTLETTMQGLVLDDRSAVALELAATSTSRQFLLRADHPLALRHLEHQIQARYPQAPIRPSSQDPLALAPGEECSIIELCPGAASYLPLRTWKPRELLTDGADPLLGILSACGEIPQDARVVAQLALLPAAPTWSAGSRRRAVEHPLAQERVRQQQRDPAPGPGRLIALFVLVLVLLVLSRFPHTLYLPTWVWQAGNALLHGHAPQLTGWQIAILTGAVLGVGSVILGATVVITRLASHFGWGQPSLYDQRLVEEKTSRSAYKARLRLYVIAPGGAQTARVLSSRFRLWSILQQDKQIVWAATQAGVCAGRSVWETPRDERRRAMKALLSHAFQRGQTRVKSWRQECKAHAIRRQERLHLLAMLVASYRQYHLASGGYFRPQTLSSRHVRQLLHPLVSKRRWWSAGWAYDLPRSTHLLSVADVAALWHLPEPQDLAELPYIEQEVTRTLLAPPALTTGYGYRFGSSTHAGQTLPVTLPDSCLRQNTLAVASTGKGKSTLLLHMVRAFLSARLRQAPGIGGLLLVDFHGDLTKQALGCIPEELQDHVALIDLANAAYPIGINPLDMSQGQDRDKVVDNILNTSKALWPESFGPRTENMEEYGCQTLAEANLFQLACDPLQGANAQYTLLDLVPLFRRASFRHAVFEQVHDKFLIDWWRQYYELLDARQQAEYTSSVVTKLSKFASSRRSRYILGQPRSTVDLSELIRQEKLVLINCASGEIGSNLAALLGSVLIGLFQITLAEQARQRPDARHPFLVLIDEFQALAGINYQSMLAELRKYGGTFGLATQSLAYLDRFDRALRATVMANVEHLFAFAMAADDARLLRLDGVEPEDITSLPNYTCYARLALEGRRLPVFSVRLDAHPEPVSERVRVIVQASQRRYGRPVGDVEATLLEIQARQETMQPRKKTTQYTVNAEPEEASAEEKKDAPRRRGGRNKNGSDRSPASPPLATALAGQAATQQAFAQDERRGVEHEPTGQSSQPEGARTGDDDITETDEQEGNHAYE